MTALDQLEYYLTCDMCDKWEMTSLLFQRWPDIYSSYRVYSWQDVIPKIVFTQKQTSLQRQAP